MTAGLGFATALLTVLPLAHAQDAQPGDPRLDEPPRSQSRLRDPQGTILIGISGGVSTQSDTTFGSVGGHVGYAVITGIVPGVRGNGFFGDLTGGEVAGTLWLTPPLDFSVVPFAIGEIGYTWRELDGASSNGAIYGAGGGLHFGRPTSAWSVRAGVVYRYYDFEGDGQGFFSPLVAASFRL